MTFARIAGVGGVLAALAGAALAAGSAHAEPGKSVAERIRERQQQAMAPQHVQSQQRREQVARREQVELREYRDRNGVPLLTNRSEKYQNNSDYVEVRLERITVPTQYTKMPRQEQHAPSTISALVRRYAEQYNLNENLVYAVIRAESNGNPNAVSRAGASGLMQLMPGTASDMGVTDIFDPAQNIAGGTQYLSRMLQLFNNDIRLALAAYNAGPEAVRRHKGIPPFNETQNYVRTVLRFWRDYENTGSSAKAELLARARRHESRGGAIQRQAAAEPKHIIVHFHSGLQQPAERVEDKDPYYYIHFGQRAYPVRKELVARIVEPA